jgi:microbial collagenase
MSAVALSVALCLSPLSGVVTAHEYQADRTIQMSPSQSAQQRAQAIPHADAMPELMQRHQHNDIRAHADAPRLVSPLQFLQLQQFTAESTHSQSPFVSAHLKSDTHALNAAPSNAPSNADTHVKLSNEVTRNNPAVTSHSIARNNSAVNNAKPCTDVAMLKGLTGSVLIQTLKEADLRQCVYGLYNKSLVNDAVFSDANILTVVTAINEHTKNYDGTEKTDAAGLEKLIGYLRALHWVHADGNRNWPKTYRDTLHQATERYLAGSHFVRFDGEVSRNYFVRYEWLVLINSAGLDALSYLPRISEALSGYNASIERGQGYGVTYEENGLTQVLTHFFNAATQEPQKLALLFKQQPAVLKQLTDFVIKDGLWLIGTEREYQWNDAVNEVGRLLSLAKHDASVKTQLQPVLKTILNTYKYDGRGGKAWTNAQSMVLSYDKANCASYGNTPEQGALICKFDLESTILSGKHRCESSNNDGDVTLRYQPPLTNREIASICETTAAQRAKFHRVMGTDPTKPVANDRNTRLEMVIFQSSTDYQNYAGKFFSINTDNGGMYLEGTPSDANNQARFIAYIATWLKPEFHVWNLEHEFIHHMDGRYNTWGGFSDTPSNAVGWVEGIAEYLSQPANNSTILEVAKSNTYTFSDLTNTSYDNGDTTRIYRWGYLYSRYLFERHHDTLLQDLLATLRAPKRFESDAPCQFSWGWRSKDDVNKNNWHYAYDDGNGYWLWTCGQDKAAVGDTSLPAYTPYSTLRSTWGKQYDTDFRQWLDCIVEAKGDEKACATPAKINNPPRIVRPSLQNPYEPEQWIVLDASQSSDPDGDTLRFEWRQIAGPTISIEGTQQPRVQFKTPPLLKPSSVLLELSVSDGKISSRETFTLDISRQNKTPMIQLAPVPNVVAGNSRLTLDASLSKDENDDPLQFHWQQLSGPALIHENGGTWPQSAAISLTSPVVNQDTQVLMQLTVSDGELSRTHDFSFIIAKTNQAPEIRLNAPAQVVAGSLVTVDATQSTDANNDKLQFNWQQLSGPAISLNNTRSAALQFTAPQITKTAQVQLLLTVSDGILSSEQLVNISISAQNVAPTLIVNSSHSAARAGTEVIIDASQSHDANDDTLTYQLLPQQGPVQGVGKDVIAKGNGIFTWHAPKVSQDTLQQFMLTVSDGTLQSQQLVSVLLQADEVIPTLPKLSAVPVTLQSNTNTATSMQHVILQSSIQLPERQAYDAFYQISERYQWQQLDGPVVQLSGEQSDLMQNATVKFSAPVLAQDVTLVFRLVVVQQYQLRDNPQAKTVAKANGLPITFSISGSQTLQLKVLKQTTSDPTNGGSGGGTNSGTTSGNLEKKDDKSGGSIGGFGFVWLAGILILRRRYRT